MNTAQSVVEASMEAVVIRCGCGDPLSHAALDLPCPNPQRVESLGVIAYYHRNLLRRALWAANQKLKGLRHAS